MNLLSFEEKHVPKSMALQKQQEEWSSGPQTRFIRMLVPFPKRMKNLSLRSGSSAAVSALGSTDGSTGSAVGKSNTGAPAAVPAAARSNTAHHIGLQQKFQQRVRLLVVSLQQSACDGARVSVSL